MTWSRELRGLGVSPGVAVGPLHVVGDWPGIDPDEPRNLAIPAAMLQVEAAMDAVATRLENLSDSTRGDGRAVLEAAAMIARDPGLKSGIERQLEKGSGLTAAVAETVDAFASQFLDMGGYFADRVWDLYDVRNRVIAQLRGAPEPGAASLESPAILAAPDLTPSDAAMLDPATCLGIVTWRGGPTGHTAILAAQKGIPTIVQVHGLDAVPTGTPVAIDGSNGKVLTHPTSEQIEKLRCRQQARTRIIGSGVGPGQTRDGEPVTLLANIGTGTDAALAAETGVEGAGLFRTEFLYLDRTEAPTLAEQTQIYREIFIAFGSRKVVVRTLDAGADKPLVFAQQLREANPALGQRGIRHSQGHTELLDTQLEALSAAATGLPVKLHVMAPMVSTVAEASWFVSRARQFGLDNVGIMVEVPGAALQVSRFAGVVDFISLGTNDLSQYLMAADRLDGRNAHLLSPWQPALLELVHIATAGAVAAQLPVGVCGEAAGDAALALVLAGMGAGSLSMAPARIGAVRAALRLHTLEQCQRLAKIALAAPTPDSARTHVIAAAHPQLSDLL